MEERICRCIKCGEYLFTARRKETALLWNIEGYKDNGIYIPHIGWLCLDHFKKEGLIHENYVKYYSFEIYPLNRRIYVLEKLSFSENASNLRVYSLKSSKPVSDFWGSYEEIKEDETFFDKRLTKIKDQVERKIWVI
ncbi:MAG: hypothetical protein ACE5K4_09505 [Candidatus Hydrothermarchaeota archaeon]